MKYPSFEKKKVVDDLPKDLQDVEVAVVLGISIASKIGESFSITFPNSSLDAIVMQDLLEVEKLIGYKREAEIEGHFTHCIQRYMKENASIIHLYFSIELKIVEL